jgi:hypothetical protein
MLAIALIAQGLASDAGPASGAGGHPPATPPVPGTEAAEARGQELAGYARAELARGRRAAWLGTAGVPLSMVMLGSVATQSAGGEALTPPAALLFGTSFVAFTVSPWLAASGAARERRAMEALGCPVPGVPLGEVGQGAYLAGAAAALLVTASPSDPVGAWALMGASLGWTSAWALGAWDHLRAERAMADCPTAQ